MKSFRTPFALLLLALSTLGLGGCLFDHPLTGVSSANIDTRLLGVFEFHEAEKGATPTPTPPPGTDLSKLPDHSIIHRVAVLPYGSLANGTCRYVIYYRNFSKKPAQTLKFLGWISRVDSRYYLTIQDITEGSPTFGKYGFIAYVWEFPGNFRVYAPDMTGFESATSFQLRQAVRKKLKSDSLFPYKATYWEKIGRTWWDSKGAMDGSAIPREFYDGAPKTPSDVKPAY
ncbi:MAG TPA: hypothetical protein VIM48_11270 [Chthoniobacterales bacterium]